MGTRRKSRELALQMLFQSDMGKQAPEEVRTTFWRGRGEVEAEVHGFAEDLFRASCDRAPDINQLIEQHAEHWRMDRIAAVDRNILRAAVAAWMSFPHTPAAGVLTQALEIARKVSCPESGPSMNATLDT